MLNHFCSGSGKEYIWLHGLLGNCLNLSPLSKVLQGKHYFLDARNHGNSFHAKGMDYKTQANDVLSFMDAQNIRKATIMGHSMGAKTAMTIACIDPNRVEKLCIMDVAPIKYSDVMNKYYGHIKRYLNFIKFAEIQGKTRKEIEALCRAQFDDVGVVNLISSNLKGSDRNFAWRVGIDYIIDGVHDIGGWEDPSGIYEGPVVAIAGGLSIHTTRSPLLKENQNVLDFYIKLFPNTVLEILKDTGHFIHVESPSLTKAAISKHFNS